MNNLLATIDAATANGYRLSPEDAGFVEALRTGAESYTPDETTNPYDAEGILVAVEEIAEEIVIPLADAAWVEIVADVRAGIVPADVADFSALHDHVDANEYLTGVEVGGSGDTDADYALVNAVSDVLNARIVAGELRG